jgi:outer membrane receptor protein involved in Fe transport
MVTPPIPLRASFVAFCHLVLGAQFLTAQESRAVPHPTTTPGATVPAADETFVLSPFTVSSQKDTGYAAANTLAGTRLNTPVRDLGSSISIYTKDFITDIGATNANELLVFATGMEAAGAQGSFSGTGNDINSDRIIGESTRARPQTQTRTRGLAAPNFTRGFFTTDIPFDSYNTEVVTVNRGPNAILFGVGSPAGVVDASPILPNLNLNQNRVEVRFGNNASARASLDLNRVIVPGKLALRTAALEDHEKFNQRPAFERKRRIYAAATYAPFRSTSVRAKF